MFGSLDIKPNKFVYLSFLLCWNVISVFATDKLTICEKLTHDPKTPIVFCKNGNPIPITSDDLTQFQNEVGAVAIETAENELNKFLKKTALESVLQRRFHALSIFGTFENGIKSEATSCYEKEFGDFKPNALLSGSREKRQNEFLRRHLYSALAALPWLKENEKLSSDLKDRHRKEKFDLLKKCTDEKRKNAKEYQYLGVDMQECEEELKSELDTLHLKYTKERNEKTGPLFELMKSFPALFAHNENSIGDSIEWGNKLMASPLMKKLVKIADGKINLGSLKTPSDLERKVTPEMNEIVNGLIKENKDELNTLAEEEMRLHASKLEEGAQVICDDEYFYGGDKDPILHHNEGLVKSVLNNLIDHFDGTDQDEKTIMMLYTSAYCSLLKKYPKESGISYAGLTGLGVLGVGAVLWLIPPVGAIYTAVAVTTGSLILGGVAIIDNIDSDDKYLVGRSLAQESWGSWDDYDRVYNDLQFDRNFNGSLLALDIAFGAFDIGTINQLRKVVEKRKKLTELFVSDPEKLGDWKEASRGLSLLDLQKLNTVLENLNPKEQSKVLKMLSGKDKKEKAALLRFFKKDYKNTIKNAEELLGMKLNEKQKKAIYSSHMIGLGEIGEDGRLAVAGNLTKEQKFKKLRKVMTDGGFSREQAKLLADNNVIGLSNKEIRLLFGERPDMKVFAMELNDEGVNYSVKENGDILISTEGETELNEFAAKISKNFNGAEIRFSDNLNEDKAVTDLHVSAAVDVENNILYLPEDAIYSIQYNESLTHEVIHLNLLKKFNNGEDDLFHGQILDPDGAYASMTAFDELKTHINDLRILKQKITLTDDPMEKMMTWQKMNQDLSHLKSVLEDVQSGLKSAKSKLQKETMTLAVKEIKNKPGEKYVDVTVNIGTPNKPRELNIPIFLNQNQLQNLNIEPNLLEAIKNGASVEERNSISQEVLQSRYFAKEQLFDIVQSLVSEKINNLESVYENSAQVVNGIEETTKSGDIDKIFTQGDNLILDLRDASLGF